jgi:two-component system, LytTR family, response regulator
MNVVIIEDCPGFVSQLKSSLRSIPDVEVTGCAATVKDGVELLNSSDVDLALIDVELSDGNAFDIFGKLNEINFNVIFITSHEHYALCAIKFSAIDYLLKPFADDELCTAINKVRRHQRISIFPANVLIDNLSQPISKKRIGLHTQDYVQYVFISDIVRCQAYGNYTQFFLSTSEKILISTPIKGFAEILEDHGFMRIHRSHMINLQHVKRFIKTGGGVVLMSDSTEIGVSRNIKKEFLNRLNNL